MQSLEEMRKELDVIDDQITTLYERRMKVCEGVAEYKIKNGRKVFDKTRENEKLAAVAEKVSTDFNKKGIRELFEQLMKLLVSKNERKQLAMEALKSVGLEDRMKHKPNEMSGGQQQRVAVARAVAAKPPIILADEPTGNLDTKSTQEIMEILKELHRSGRTVIIITHDEEIASQAHRVIRILDGRIEEDYCNR